LSILERSVTFRTSPARTSKGKSGKIFASYHSIELSMNSKVGIYYPTEIPFIRAK